MESICRKAASTIVPIAAFSPGRTKIGRLFLGSVSKKVAEDADCSVRVARSVNEKRGKTPPRIVIGVNDSPTAFQVILSVVKRV